MNLDKRFDLVHGFLGLWSVASISCLKVVVSEFICGLFALRFDLVAGFWYFARIPSSNNLKSTAGLE